MTRLAALLLRSTLALAALSAGPAGAAETLVVARGASSTAGKGVGPAAADPAQLEAMLDAKGHHVRVINAGIDGDTSAGMLSRLDSDVPAGTALVILQTGTNDARDPGHDETIGEILARLRARSILVVPLRTALMRDLRAGYAQADGHHLTGEGYRILAARLLPSVEGALRRR